MSLIFVFCPSLLLADSTLNFPRLSADSSLLTGVAIVNPNSSDASVTLTAFAADGSLLAGPGVSNPVSVTVPANQQFSKLTSELFGSPLPPNAAWFQATSSSDGLTGFFLLLNLSVSLMDGADTPPAPDQKIIFNSIRIDSGFSTELNLINPGSSDAHLRLALTGTPFPPAPSSLTIPAHGAARLDAASFFAVSNLSPAAFVVVDSDAGVAGFEFVRSPSADAFALNARSAAERLSSLYFLQTSLLGSFQSSLSLLNYSSDPVVLTISAFNPDGSLFDSSSLKFNPVTRALNPNSSLNEDLQSMFGFSGSTPIEGWILVKSTSSAINGFLSYSDSSSGALAAITSPPSGSTRAIFSHIASSSGFSTGLSLLNPGSLAANVRVLAIQKDGTILGVFDTVLQPSQRFKRFLGTSDLIPQAANQTGGIIFVKSDIPIYMSSLITSTSASVNIPPQPAPDSYNPDASISSLKMNPPIAIIPPGASQRFSVNGSSSYTWKVNGAPGGSASTGTISSSGLFTAPKSVPARQVVTISAESSSQAAGASADVLDKVPFTSGLGVVQSVAYLDSLGKVYSAELAALSSAPSSASAAAPSGNSQIFEVSSTAPKLSVASFPGEVIPKIIPFKADNGTQFLLLSAQSSGRVIRLDPVTKQFRYIATGLNQPSSLVIDPNSGDLLVVEQDKISTLPKSTLQADLSAPELSRFVVSSPSLSLPPLAASLFPFSGGAGIVIDRCTKKIYSSSAALGTIVEFDPSTGLSRTLSSGLNNPGQMLGLYRADVSCPLSFQILVAQRGSNEASLVLPSSGAFFHWADVPGITDIALLNAASGTLLSPDLIPASDSAPALFPQDASAFSNGILLSDQGGGIDFVPTSNYNDLPPNPPAYSLVASKVDLALSMSHSPDSVIAYEPLTFSISVSNSGPAHATGVNLTDSLPSGASFLSATASQGTCSQSGNVVYCNLGSIPVNGSVSASVTVAPNYSSGTSSYSLINSAYLTSSEVDSNPSNNSASDTATVASPSPSKLALSGLPAAAVPGTPVSFTVSAVDKFGKTTTNYDGTVHFSSSDPSASLPPNYSFSSSDAGSHSFSVYFNSIGSQTISVQDTTSSSLSDSKTVIVLPSSLSMSASAPSVSVGAPFSITVTARDVFGNAAAGYTGTVAFSSSDPSASLPGRYTFTSADHGSHTFNNAFGFGQQGSQKITVTDLASPDTQASLTFDVVAIGSSSVAASFQVTAAPPSATAGSLVSITVTAKDLTGNVAGAYTGTVIFSSSDTTATYDSLPLLDASYQFQPSDNGTRTFSIIFYKAGTQTFTVTEGTLGAPIARANGGAVHLSVGSRPVNDLSPPTGSTSVIVNPGALSTFTVAGLAAAVAGANDVTVTAKDPYGNIKTDYIGTIRFTDVDTDVTFSVDGGTNYFLSPSYTFTTGIGLDNGVHTFTNGVSIPGCSLSNSVTVTDADADVSGSEPYPHLASSCAPLPPPNQNSVQPPPGVLTPPRARGTRPRP